MSRTMLSAKNIDKLFGPRLILNSLTYDFSSGKVYAILGESGSGKTTLLNVLGLLDNKYDGDIFIENHQISKSKDNYEIRNNKIGFVFQSYYLIDYLNVRENIFMPLEYSKNKIDENYYEFLLNALNIKEIEKERVNYLSGGEKQRVAIARALINKPDIIICDEPTGNLDSNNSLQVLSMLKQFITEDKLIIIVTHDINVAQKSDVIIKLECGKLYENY